MGNSITNNASRGKYGETLKMSNGGTSVFFSVLLLAGSDFAQTDWQKKFMYWLAEKDIGGGLVGFDVAELSWKSSTFEEQKRFILETVDRAIEGHGWDELNYNPPLVRKYLTQFRELIEEYEVEYVDESQDWTFLEEPQQFQKCALHKVFLHQLDPDPTKCCLLCNNAAID